MDTDSFYRNEVNEAEDGKEQLKVRAGLAKRVEGQEEFTIDDLRFTSVDAN